MAKFTKLNIGDSVASSGGRVWKKLSAESAEEEVTLEGTWVFNEVPAISSDFIVDFDYTSAGINYTRMQVKTLATDGYAERILYQKTDSIAAYINSQYQVNWWRNSGAYRTITITTAPTDTAFITWLKANATKTA